ncbi:hypothetical protein B6S59_31070 [Pseudomonas sp. A46]|nr:hypothetical protein [Pseudomonas sp. A46]OWJ89327.1 hypothetical protein B6S59_31070 [Pseudomonas sp. A46]
MATEIRPELAARIAEMDAITDRYRDLDSYDEPSIYARKQTMSQVYGDFDRIAEGVVDERNIRYLADDHVRLLEQLPGKPEQQELAYYIGNAMSSNGEYKQAVEQRAAALASSFGWALPGDKFQLTIDAAMTIQERNRLAKDASKTADFAGMMADRKDEVAAWTQEYATIQAKQDIAAFRQEGSKYEQDYKARDMAFNAGSNLFYRESLDTIEPGIRSEIDDLINSAPAVNIEIPEDLSEAFEHQLPADQDPELIALAEKLEEEVGLAGIRKRADAFAGSISQLGLDAAKETITLDVARDWVAADVRDFGVIEEQSQIHEAATVMLVNAGKVGLYGQELKSSEPALSASLKEMAAPLDQESSIKQRDQVEGKPSSPEEARIRANEDALEIVLGCDASDQGLAVVSRNMNNKDYRESFKETVSEFIALNEDGPFYDAERFWAAQRIIQVSERKEYLRQGGEPELSDWAILLAEVLQKQRRPLSGAEFKELVTALEGAARDANTQKAEIHQVVGLLAKVHGSSGESLFRDNELRGAYRDGLREQSGAEPQLLRVPSADVTQDVKKRSAPAMRA